LDGPVNADVSCRVAWADDAPAIAAVQVRAWRASYAAVADVPRSWAMIASATTPACPSAKTPALGVPTLVTSPTA
jgi:hypothetical protein